MHAIVQPPIASLPNAITASRVVMAPLACAALWGELYLLALLVVAAAGLSDYLDGEVARRTGTHSQFGQEFDPIADKWCVNILLAALLGLELLHYSFWAVLLLTLLYDGSTICMRRFIKERIRTGLTAEVPLSPSLIAKSKTALQFAGITLGCAGPLHTHAQFAAELVLALSALAVIWSGILYAQRYGPSLCR